MSEDRDILRRYAEGSDEAFGELVSRHVGLVYATALRRVGGNVHMAQDVSQMVFSELARCARVLPQGVVLAGWLHRAACFKAAQVLRAERRRRAREEKAMSMNQPEEEANLQWDDLQPLLDEALEQLGMSDRDALLLRFFQQRTLAEVGEALGASEEAARKRVDRALDKLRHILGRRGITATSGALAAMLCANAAQSVPAGLAALLAGTAITTAASTSSLTILILRVMALTKLQTATVCLLVAAAPVCFQWHGLSSARAENKSLRDQLSVTTDEATAQRRLLDQTERREGYAEHALAEATAGIAEDMARIRLAGSSNDPSLYLWSDHSDYVRVPKGMAKTIRLSSFVEVPVSGGLRQIQEPAVFSNGALSTPFEEALQITKAEQSQVKQAFAELQQSYAEMARERSYMTNSPPTGLQVGTRESRTLVTDAFPEEGSAFKERLRRSLVSALGEERADVLWQQADTLFQNEFNDFGSRIRFETVAVGPNQSLSTWDVSRLPSETSFSTWVNSSSSGNIRLEHVKETFREFVAEQLQKQGVTAQP